MYKKLFISFIFLLFVIPYSFTQEKFSCSEFDLHTKYVEINGLKIAYYETKGHGPVIVLVHGNSQSKECFKQQLLTMGFYYRMVAIDLPGCGESDKSTNPFETYSSAGLGSIFEQLIDSLNLNNAVWVGLSFGGHLLLEFENILNAKGIMIYGTPPISYPPAPEAFLPNPNFMLGFTPVLTEEQITSYGQSLFRPGFNVPQFVFDGIRNTDGMFRLAIGYMLNTGSYRDEVDIVKNLQIPIAILHGAKDQLINVEYIKTLNIPKLWKNRVQIIPNAGHNIQWERPIRFNLMLIQFVQFVNK
jgi:pimeloyl-ACP methyl ester carboxylesterase